MGTHGNSCFGNLPLCLHGATFSMWYKLGPQNLNEATLFRSPYLSIFCEKRSPDSKIYVDVQNEMLRQRFSELPSSAPGIWHQIGITYSKTSDFKVSNSSLWSGWIWNRDVVFNLVPCSSLWDFGKWLCDVRILASFSWLAIICSLTCCWRVCCLWTQWSICGFIFLNN